MISGYWWPSWTHPIHFSTHNRFATVLTLSHSAQLRGTGHSTDHAYAHIQRARRTRTHSYSSCIHGIPSRNAYSARAFAWVHSRRAPARSHSHCEAQHTMPRMHAKSPSQWHGQTDQPNVHMHTSTWANARDFMHAHVVHAGTYAVNVRMTWEVMEGEQASPSCHFDSFCVSVGLGARPLLQVRSPRHVRCRDKQKGDFSGAPLEPLKCSWEWGAFN